jgi:hypothetical protein
MQQAVPCPTRECRRQGSGQCVGKRRVIRISRSESQLPLWVEIQGPGHETHPSNIRSSICSATALTLLKAVQWVLDAPSGISISIFTVGVHCSS